MTIDASLLGIDDLCKAGVVLTCCVAVPPEGKLIEHAAYDSIYDSSYVGFL